MTTKFIIHLDYEYGTPEHEVVAALAALQAGVISGSGIRSVWLSIQGYLDLRWYWQAMYQPPYARPLGMAKRPPAYETVNGRGWLIGTWLTRLVDDHELLNTPEPSPLEVLADLMPGDSRGPRGVKGYPGSDYGVWHALHYNLNRLERFYAGG